MRLVLDTNLLVSPSSGDKRDLLPMGSFSGIPIISAREAAERLEHRREG